MPRTYTSRVTLTCKTCGQDFRVCPSHIQGGRRKFCSRACANTAQTTKTRRVCEACGKSFSRVVSDTGRFCSRSCANGTPLSRFKKYTGKTEAGGCIPWVGLRDQDGYGKIWTGKRLIRAHRFAWEQAHGPVPDGLLVLHSCDNPPCVNAAHLFLGTHAVNHADRNEKDRQAKGERSGNAKLTEASVIEIRSMRAAGMVQQQIADRFGINQATVSAILLRKTWKHV